MGGITRILEPLRDKDGRGVRISAMHLAAGAVACAIGLVLGTIGLTARHPDPSFTRDLWWVAGWVVGSGAMEWNALWKAVQRRELVLEAEVRPPRAVARRTAAGLVGVAVLAAMVLAAAGAGRSGANYLGTAFVGSGTTWLVIGGWLRLWEHRRHAWVMRRGRGYYVLIDQSRSAAVDRYWHDTLAR